jgi:hypothetical protein
MNHLSEETKGETIQASEKTTTAIAAIGQTLVFMGIPASKVCSKHPLFHQVSNG